MKNNPLKNATWRTYTVADGLPGNVCEHVAEAQGSGLGLAIVKKSVKLLGGKIQAESEVGNGTTFTLQIKDYTK